MNHVEGGGTSAQGPCGKQAAGLGFLLLAALLLRSIHLGRAELWQDEMIFVDILSTHGESAWTTFLRYWHYLISMGQMPLAGVLQNIIIRTLVHFGIEDAIYRPGLMRLPMVLLGTAAVGGVFLSARRLLEPGAAWMAGLLMTVAFYPVFYSRQAYCYAPILFFAAWGLAAWLKLYQEGGKRPFFLAWLCFAGLALSHVGAMVALAAWTATGGALWLLARTGKASPERTKRTFFAALAPGLALLVGSPYLIHFLRHNKAHIGAMPDQSLFLIVNDGLNRMFLGEQPVAALLAWLIAGLGFYGLLRRESRNTPPGRGLLAGAAATGMLLLAFASLRSQYAAARYFSPLAPMLYLVFAQGLWILAQGAARILKLRSGRGLGLCRGLVATLFLAPHLLLFLPRYWPLESKDEPFGWVAEWLNTNLPPGSLYLLESAYQYRFLGGYHRTPNLFPLAPYVQGQGPEEMRRLQEIQMDVCRRFPEAVFIALGHPGWDHQDRPWEWPARHFRRRVTLRNDALHRLIRTGIFPREPYKPLEDFQYRFDLYYNTPEDRAARAREESGVLFEFPGWMPRGQPVSPAEILYFRAAPGRRGTLAPVNVSGSDQLGQLVLQAAVPGEAGSEPEFTVLWKDEPIYAGRQPANALFEIRTRPFRLPPGRHRLEVRAEPDAPGGLILWDARWEP